MWHRLDRPMGNNYAMCVEWTKPSEVENRSLSIRLLHVAETIRLRLCIKFVRDDRTLKNECSCHFKLLQQFRFHHHSCCCFKIFHDWNNYSIVHSINILKHSWSKMCSVQAMHENMFNHLMTSFAVASKTIHAWNVSWMQINVQIYAFNFDVSCKNAFNFLKIILHLYCLVKQMKSLCWSCIDVCNIYLVVFSSMILFTLVILCYCNAITHWNHHQKIKSFASRLYLCVFMNKSIEKYYFLDDRRARNEIINFYQMSMYEFACSFSLSHSVVNLTA